MHVSDDTGRLEKDLDAAAELVECARQKARSESAFPRSVYRRSIPLLPGKIEDVVDAGPVPSNSSSPTSTFKTVSVSSKVSSACCVMDRARLAMSVSAFFNSCCREDHSRQQLSVTIAMHASATKPEAQSVMCALPRSPLWLTYPHSALQSCRLTGSHRTGGDVVLQREHRDRGLADRKGRCRNDRRKKSLEPLSRLRKLGRDTRPLRMDLSADTVREQAHDPLAVGRGHRPSAVLQTTRQPIDPEPAIGIEHHLKEAEIRFLCRDGGRQFLPPPQLTHQQETCATERSGGLRHMPLKLPCNSAGLRKNPRLSSADPFAEYSPSFPVHSMNVENMHGDIQTDCANAKRTPPLSGVKHLHFGASMPSAGSTPS